VVVPDSTWLKEYHSRIIEEYKFSMERKDRLTDWAIGIFFVTLVAYAELLREQVPSIWRVSLIVGLSCFIMRLFMNSCLAYAYLEKWRYLLDLIEKHRMTDTTSLDFVKKEIEKYHYTPRTTKKRIHFIKSQLLTGFFLLFLFPFSILLFELYSNALDLYVIIPISFLVVYYFLEFILFIEHKALGMPVIMT
jgi:fatty acid desaturase